jgi:hypothetical protein
MIKNEVSEETMKAIEKIFGRKIKKVEEAK